MGNEGDCDSYNFSGWIIGGRCNDYGDSQGRHSKPKPSKKHTKQQLGGGSYPYGPHHPPGAISYAYSFTPAYQQYPPPPPYQYPPPPQMADGGHGYYGSSQMTGGGYGYYGGGYHGQGYPGQYPPPINHGGYNYGMSHNYSRAHQHMNVGSWPDHGHHDNKLLGQDHNLCGEHVVINKDLPSSGAVTAGAAANGGHAHAVSKHPHHEQSLDGKTAKGDAAAGAAAATAVYSHG